MTREAVPMDLHQMPDLARLAQEVRRTKLPIVLREDGEDVAILSPAETKRRLKGTRVTQADIDAALATFGTWMDLDAETFLRELDEARSDTSPPIEL